MLFRYNVPMSATEILEELPKLTESERRAVRRKLLELAAQNEDVRLCDQAATDSARLLDAMEEADGRTQKG